MKTTKIATARALLNPEVKKQAEAILKELGLSVSKSFELFCRKIIAQHGLPFELHVPNEKTMKLRTPGRVGVEIGYFLETGSTIQPFNDVRLSWFRPYDGNGNQAIDAG